MVEEIELESYYREGGVLRPVYIQSERSFYLKNLIDEPVLRGNHAHRETTQWLFACSGNPRLDEDTFSMDKTGIHVQMNQKTLYKVHPMTWIMLNLYYGDSVIVWCDKPYSEDDYIHDFDEFKRLTK